MVYGIYGIYHIVYGSGNYRFINHKTLYTTPLVARAALNYWIGAVVFVGVSWSRVSGGICSQVM